MAKGRPRNPDRSKTKTNNKNLPTELAPTKPPAVGIQAPPPPPGLDESLHVGWRVICEDLICRGHTQAALREVDLEMVRQLLEAVWVHQQATEILHLEGIMIYKRAEIRDPQTGEPTGETVVLDAKQHPAVKTQREAAATYLRFADALAVNPQARVRAGLMIAATASLASTIKQGFREAIERAK